MKKKGMDLFTNYKPINLHDQICSAVAMSDAGNAMTKAKGLVLSKELGIGYIESRLCLDFAAASKC